MRLPDPDPLYPDAEVIWSSEFGDNVGVWVATNLLDGGEPDPIPVRVRVTTEDGTGSAYLTIEDAYELVQALGNAITKAKQLRDERGRS